MPSKHILAPEKSIWIVSDIRRKTDIKWFEDNYPNRVKTIRIKANDEIREKRGWKFTQGVDDVTSECDLDDFSNWDLEIINEDPSKVETNLEILKNFIVELL